MAITITPAAPLVALLAPSAEIAAPTAAAPAAIAALGMRNTSRGEDSSSNNNNNGIIIVNKTTSIIIAKAAKTREGTIATPPRTGITTLRPITVEVTAFPITDVMLRKVTLAMIITTTPLPPGIVVVTVTVGRARLNRVWLRR